MQIEIMKRLTLWNKRKSIFQITSRDPCLSPQVVMEEDDGDQEGVEEEGEKKADQDDDANSIWFFVGLHQVYPRQRAIRECFHCLCSKILKWTEVHIQRWLSHHNCINLHKFFPILADLKTRLIFCRQCQLLAGFSSSLMRLLSWAVSSINRISDTTGL